MEVLSEPDAQSALLVAEAYLRQAEVLIAHAQRMIVTNESKAPGSTRIPHLRRSPHRRASARRLAP